MTERSRKSSPTKPRTASIIAKEVARLEGVLKALTRDYWAACDSIIEDGSMVEMPVTDHNGKSWKKIVPNPSIKIKRESSREMRSTKAEIAALKDESDALTAAANHKQTQLERFMNRRRTGLQIIRKPEQTEDSGVANG